MVYVDDAHGEGVLGPGGRGIVSHFNLGRDRVHVEMGTFSKAFGVVGGHISGSIDLIRFAYNKSRTWLLSGSHPPPVAAACLAAIDVLESEPEHVERLWTHTRRFKKEMAGLGFDIGHSETPITPVIVGDSARAQELSRRLFDLGVFALPIVYPMVEGESANSNDHERRPHPRGCHDRHRGLRKGRSRARVDLTAQVQIGYPASIASV